MPETGQEPERFYCVCPIENGSETSLPSLRRESVLVAVERDKGRVAAQGQRRRRTDGRAGEPGK